MLNERSIYLRKLVLRAMRAGRRGHYGSSASLIEIMRVIYDIAKYDSMNPKWENRDRIILSKGHGVLAQAVLLADKGFFPLEELDKFCMKEAVIGGHPSPNIPGVECHTGALGHGLGIACGMAIAAKIKKKNHRIFVVIGDGEIQEGSCWEAFMCMAKHKLNNITVVVDYNKLQSSGVVNDVCPLEPLIDKTKAFGLACYSCDGHDVDALKIELSQRYERPNCIVANTIKGRGIPFAENNPSFHYKGNIDDKLMEEMESALK